MKLQLPKLNDSCKPGFPKKITSAKQAATFVMLLTFLMLISVITFAQGTWVAVAATAPDQNGGGCLLLSDGSVICKSFGGGTDGIGNIYDRLVPDSHGSYANGTWSRIAPMHNTRLYYSSQVLKDGRVYVAGGEYGSGGSAGEVYNPLTNTWTLTPSYATFVSDANSEILEDGRVLQASVYNNLRQTYIYDPVTNTHITGPSCIGLHNECTWVKLPDNSILMVDRDTKNSERYIPAMNTWIADGNVPVNLYDNFGSETGAGLLLPDGRAFLIGAPSTTAYYTPTGNTSAGTWIAGPTIPQHKGAPDAASAMMVNGKILVAVSPAPSFAGVFQTPTNYAVFNPVTNTATPIPAPGGGSSIEIPCYYTGMLCLPDGTILYSQQYSSNYYIFVPDGEVTTANKPVIKSIYKSGAKVFTMTGTGFNGNSEGACYGDDWQMSTNYPIIRMTKGTNVYYARTFNWNSTGVQRGSKKDTTQLTLPNGFPRGTYSVVVTANGISSDPITVTYNPISGELTPVNDTKVIAAKNSFKVFPNPAKDKTTLYYTLVKPSHISLKMLDANANELETLLENNQQQGEHSIQISTTRFKPGMYYIRMKTESGVENIKLIVQ